MSASLTSVDVSEAAREARLRRKARRQGRSIVKSKTRDPRAPGYGGYMIVDDFTNSVVDGEIDSWRALSLDEVEAALNA